MGDRRSVGYIEEVATGLLQKVMWFDKQALAHNEGVLRLAYEMGSKDETFARFKARLNKAADKARLEKQALGQA